MIGILVELLISWLLIWLIERQDLRVLGSWPSQKRIIQFLLFFLLTALFSASGFMMQMNYGSRWILNDALTTRMIFEGIRWNIISVLYEELIFRGVILYILIKRFGAVWGITISSIAFGIYHWFSFEIIGNVPQMINIFVVTGLMGAVLAYSFWKTKSMYAQIGIHLGWNLVQTFIFSSGVIGKQVLIPIPTPPVQVSWFVFIMVMYGPMACTLLINFLILKKLRPVQPI
jgi:uncharacterized protein